MLVQNAIDEIRLKINDRDEIGLDDDELLNYLNEAVQFISAYMVSFRSPQLVREAVVEDETYTLPENFAQFCGGYPIKQTGSVVQLLDDPPLKLRFFVSYPILSEEDEMPFNHIALTQVAIKIASVYANAQERLDISQDKTLVQELQQAVAASMGAGE